MNRLRNLFVLAAAFVAMPVLAQEPPKPGPEIEGMKKNVGNWEMTMKMPQGESKGTCTYKMDLGGLWLSCNVEMDMGGMKFTGHGMDSYDATKKKYVGVWFDSFSTTPLVMEGTYDKDKKTLTMSGDGPGMDGKITKHTLTTTWKDDDNFVFSMFHGDAKEPSMTINYKRKK